MTRVSRSMMAFARGPGRGPLRVGRSMRTCPTVLLMIEDSCGNSVKGWKTCTPDLPDRPKGARREQRRGTSRRTDRGGTRRAYSPWDYCNSDSVGGPATRLFCMRGGRARIRNENNPYAGRNAAVPGGPEVTPAPLRAARLFSREIHLPGQQIETAALRASVGLEQKQGAMHGGGLAQICLRVA